MAYVGTPIDTQNQFQSLVGKRFSGDASTTAFTLDVAPSSTLDIEVFVENVRQDPNSAYSLSGTTLTFAAAPPSGTNNIYVVHQAKAVGTISPAAGTVNADSFDNTVISGHTALAATPADTDEFLVSDAGTIKRVDFSHIKGVVRQVVQTSLTASDYFSTTASSMTEVSGSPAFTVSITPSSTSSKVLITGHVSVGTGTGARVGIQLRRGDSTIIGSADAAGSRQRAASAMRNDDGNYATTLTFNFLDSPSSTSEVTYKIFGMAEGSETFQINKGNGDTDNATVFRSASTLTAMEILA